MRSQEDDGDGRKGPWRSGAGVVARCQSQRGMDELLQLRVSQRAGNWRRFAADALLAAQRG